MKTVFMGGPGDGSEWECDPGYLVLEYELKTEHGPRYGIYYREMGDEKFWFGGDHHEQRWKDRA